MPNPDTRAAVFELVKQIPRGKVASYGQLARLAGITNPRQVGRILHSNTAPEIYPCHRVIRADGSLAGGYAFGGLGVQQQKLEAEGVTFVRGRVDWSKHRWQS